MATAHHQRIGIGYVLTRPAAARHLEDLRLAELEELYDWLLVERNHRSLRDAATARGVPTAYLEDLLDSLLASVYRQLIRTPAYCRPRPRRLPAVGNDDVAELTEREVQATRRASLAAASEAEQRAAWGDR